MLILLSKFWGAVHPYTFLFLSIRLDRCHGIEMEMPSTLFIVE